MKREKLLWGWIAVLSAAVIVLVVLLLQGGTAKDMPPNKQQPTKSPEATPIGDTDNGIIAKIGDQTIAHGDFIKKLYQKNGAELLNQMLDRMAMQMEADALHISVDEAEIKQELKRMQQGYDSEAEFYQSMQEQLGMSKDDIHEDVFYRLLGDKLATHSIVVSDQEVEDYINAHPEEFQNTVQLRIAQIINQTREQSQHSADLARGGRDFAELAKERSLDTETANDGGDLGWVDEDDPFVPAPILQAAKSMKPGEISNPIPLNSRFAVIKLVDRKVITKGTPEEIRDAVHKQLALQKAPSIKDYVKQLRDKYHAQILDPALQK